MSRILEYRRQLSPRTGRFADGILWLAVVSSGVGAACLGLRGPALFGDGVWKPDYLFKWGGLLTVTQGLAGGNSILFACVGSWANRKYSENPQAISSRAVLAFIVGGLEILTCAGG